MSKDANIRRRAAGQRDADEGSLNEALDDLENIIERRRRDETPSDDAGEAFGVGVDDVPAHPEPASGMALAKASDCALAGPLSTAPASEVVETPALDYDRIAERLASEVEVIINARVESALRDTLAELRREVRKHIAIVLPELLDEVLQEDRSR